MNNIDKKYTTFYDFFMTVIFKFLEKKIAVVLLLITWKIIQFFFWMKISEKKHNLKTAATFKQD